jgi:hypothetical protein
MWNQLLERFGIQAREPQIRVVNRNRIAERNAERSVGLGATHGDVRIMKDVSLDRAFPRQVEVELSMTVRQARIYPSHVGEGRRVAVDLERHVARVEHVAAVAARFRARQRDRGTLPPDGIVVERKDAFEIANERAGCTERERVHPQRRHLEQAIFLPRLREPEQRNRRRYRVELHGLLKAAWHARDQKT